MKLSTITVTILVGLATPYAKAATIYFNTSTAVGWSATGGGAQNATPYVFPYDLGGGNTGKAIGVTSSGNNSGAFLSGGSLANFNGFWTASYSFSLPPDAANVSLNYADFVADDRGVLMLNGNIIGSSGFPSTPGQLNGVMVFADGGTPQAYTFDGSVGVSGTATSGFNIGGLNTLEVIMNNTGTGLAGAMKGQLAWNDGTGFGLSASVSYSIIPEPSTGVLGLCGLACLSCSRSLRGRKNS